MRGTVTLTALKLFILKVFIFIYDIITLPIYFIIQKPWRNWKSSRTVWAQRLSKDDPYSPVIRVKTGESRRMEGITTVDQLFRIAISRHGTRKCSVVREVISEADEYFKNGKVMKKVQLGDYSWSSYLDIENRVETLSNGLLSIGLQPKRQVVIFAETRIEWFLTLHACLRVNVPVATLYATLGEEGVIHGINETEATTIVTSQELLPKLEKMIQKIPNVNQIIVMENIRPINACGFPDTVKIIKFSEVEEIGSRNETFSKPDPPVPDDLAIIMYTSGSTGIPKGVLMSHKNIIASITGLQDEFTYEKNDVYIAYLPLAHVYEIMVECTCLIVGISIGYSSPLTLTDTATGLMYGCKGDATLLRPTVLTAVPLVLDRVKKSVQEKVAATSPFAKEFFDYAIKYKKYWVTKGFDTPILNRLVFRKIQQVFGGRVRLLGCGSAPLSLDTNYFVRTCLDVKITQGYGLTETACSATVMSVKDCSFDGVGPPLVGCYIKMVDWEEGNYSPNDKPNPRGEIVIGGECITMGYFKNEDLTNECYKEEDGMRWFYTGDIGELQPNGSFKIIDRKKDLVKLQHGEYLSLGKIETELKTCPLVDNICVVGDGLHNNLVALVVPNVSQVQSIACTMGKKDLPWNELCTDENLVSIYTKQLLNYGQKNGLQRRELPTKLFLCPEEWTPESGLITAAFKIRRKIIEQFYKSVIEKLYNTPDITVTTVL